MNAKTVQDRHTQRGIEMDNKVLDKAVEVLVTRLDLNPDYFGTEEIRESFLAGVKVLLGEPVAWAHPLDVDAMADADMETGNVVRLFPTDNGDAPRVAIYAPSLGEGDGRPE